MFKGCQFDRSLILLCVRWYLAYGLSLRNLEEMMAERGISVDHSTIHRWVLRFSPKLLKSFNLVSVRSRGNGTLMRPISRSVGSGCISTEPSTASVTRSSFISAKIATFWQQSAFSGWRLFAIGDPVVSSLTAARPTGRPSPPAIWQIA